MKAMLRLRMLTWSAARKEGHAVCPVCRVVIARSQRHSAGPRLLRHQLRRYTRVPISAAATCDRPSTQHFRPSPRLFFFSCSQCIMYGTILRDATNIYLCNSRKVQPTLCTCPSTLQQLLQDSHPILHDTTNTFAQHANGEKRDASTYLAIGGGIADVDMD